MRAKNHGFSPNDRYRVEALLGQVGIELAEAAQIVKKTFLDEPEELALEFADALIRLGYLADTLHTSLDGNFPHSAWTVSGFNALGNVVSDGAEHDGDPWHVLAMVQEMVMRAIMPAQRWREDCLWTTPDHDWSKEHAQWRHSFDRRLARLFGEICGLGRVLGLDLDRGVREKSQYNAQRPDRFNLADEFGRN